MELYNRLINEGVFIFWADASKNDNYTIKLYLCMGEKKIELLEEKIPGNRHSCSLDKLGSGEYLIELHAFKNGKLTETLEKKVNLSSSIQKLAELKEELEEVKNMLTYVHNDTSVLREIRNLLQEPSEDADVYDWAKFLKRVVYYMRRDT